MKYNTAIFYDIENLIGGYNISNVELLINLSLKQIMAQVKQKNIGKIAIQRAYADWSAPRLNQLKADMVELGVEPKQMFGFGKGAVKNAADIQLCIDVMEVAFTKPDVEIFVVVSGDGGFSSLANKLHEYGKFVIGCAYKRSTNKIFEAIADEFIWLSEPNTTTVPLNFSENGVRFGENYLTTFARQYKPLSDVCMETAQKVSAEIFAFMIANHDINTKLMNGGVNVSIFAELFRYRLSGFLHKAYGFPRSIDFIQSVIEKSELKLVLKGLSDYRLTLKNHKVVGFDDVVKTPERPPEHTLDNYKQILSTESPSFRQFDKQMILTISGHLCDKKKTFQKISLESITKKLNRKFSFDSLEIVKTVTSLISGGCFVINAETSTNTLDSQTLSFVPDSPEQSLALLEKAMERKIVVKLNRVNSNVFNGILT